MKTPKNTLIRSVKRLYLLMNYHIEEELKSYGLARSQFQVIYFLYQERKLSQKDLQIVMQVEPATLTVIIDSLEKKGLLKRVVSKTDKRSRTLQLTAKGQKLRESIPSINKIMETRMFRGIEAADKKQMKALFEKIIQNLEKRNGNN